MKRFSIAAAILLLMTGCVTRTLHVQTDPPGALVYLNDQEVGRTPLERDFRWYGNYDVVIRRDGYETLKTSKWIVAPWWQWPPIDLFAELLPFGLTDRQRMSFKLQPASTQPVEADQILARAAEMEGMLESSRAARRAAATKQPSQPSSR